MFGPNGALTEESDRNAVFLWCLRSVDLNIEPAFLNRAEVAAVGVLSALQDGESRDPSESATPVVQPEEPPRATNSGRISTRKLARLCHNRASEECVSGGMDQASLRGKFAEVIDVTFLSNMFHAVMQPYGLLRGDGKRVDILVGKLVMLVGKLVQNLLWLKKRERHSGMDTTHSQIRVANYATTLLISATSGVIFDFE